MKMRRIVLLRPVLAASLALLVGMAAQLVPAESASGAKETPKAAPLPRPKPDPKSASAAPTSTVKNIPLPRSKPGSERAALPAPTAEIPALPISAKDLGGVKQAVTLIQQGKVDAAHALTRDIDDRVARKVVEWVILRSGYTDAITFERFTAFINENPSWPSVDLFRRRAEGALWEDKREDKIVRAYFAKETPQSAKGRLVLARALVAQGDKKTAEPIVREVWRHDSLTVTLETMVFNAFGDMLTRADHKARMDDRLYDNEPDAALRMAQRLGPNDVAIAKARIAVIKNASNAKALLDAVPAEARKDLGYMFSRISWLRRNGKIVEAAELMLQAPNDPAVLYDLDQWWMERRFLCRNLLDIGDAKTAYRIARDAAQPTKENYRVDYQFTAGWIALRFLKDPATALTHFSHIPWDGLKNPHALSRANYWEGRALEALGRHDEARQRYEVAARYSSVYYGQVARGKLGLPELALEPVPPPPPTKHEVARAAEILYAADQRDLAAIMMADLGERSDDVAQLASLGDAAARYGDGRGMLLLGKGALGRGHPFDYYAYPTVGLPAYKPIGPAVDIAVTYSIARTESHFSQKVISTAKAMGFMQVTPAAGRDTAKRFSVAYDENKLMTDPVYNMQMGAGELAILFQGYRGSYIMTFAGYNAGRGRVKEWVERYGDPRDPKVDPIDWVERIPIAETRNYVQRIMENLQVYRARFGGGNRLLIEADLRRGSSSGN